MPEKKKSEMCRVLACKDGGVIFESDTIDRLSIDDVIREDERYGAFYPPTPRLFKYSILNGDEELTSREVRRIVELAFKRWTLYIPYKIKRVHPDENPDITFEFRGNEDPELSGHPNTLAYAYFPFVNNALKPVIVINKKFYFTKNGKPVSLHKIDPVNYPDPDTAPVAGMTYDLDQILAHELGHKLGLPHSPYNFDVMAPNYGVMGEFLTQHDVQRIQAKYGNRIISSRWLERLLSWLRYRSDN